MTVPFSAVYYSHGRAPLKLRQKCAVVASAAIAQAGGELITITWEPLTSYGLEVVATHSLIWPQHVAMHESLYRQILAGIDATATDIICLVEHDVLYPPSYFEAMAIAAAANPDKLIYNQHLYGLDDQGYFVPRYRYNMLSNLCAHKTTLRQWLHHKIAEIVRTGDVEEAEPGTAAGIIQVNVPVPTIDVRHAHNFTGSREVGSRLTHLDYWGAAWSWLPMKLRLFTLSHRQDLLDATPDSPYHCRVNLAQLKLGRYQSNLLGEGRAFLYDLDDGDCEYLGFVNARWDEKYSRLDTHLANLPDAILDQLSPTVVYAPWATATSYWGNDWFAQAAQCHPAMVGILRELIDFSGLRLDTGRASLWANDFICHRTVWYGWRQFWRRCFSHFHGRYGFLLPFRAENLDVSRLPAYFYERVTTLYFANRTDLQVIQLP